MLVDKAARQARLAMCLTFASLATAASAVGVGTILLVFQSVSFHPFGGEVWSAVAAILLGVFCLAFWFIWRDLRSMDRVDQP